MPNDTEANKPVVNAPAKVEEEGQQTAAAQQQQVLEAPRQRVPLVAGKQPMAIVPASAEEAYRMAQAICAADMAPKSYGRSAEKIMVGILHGLEVGLTPMAALQSIAVINGMPSIWGDGALALIQASGLLEDMKEWVTTDEKTGDIVAYCRMKRKGRAAVIEQSFSWSEAVQAKLNAKDTYKQYGRRMLQRRARAWCMTDGFADVLRGLNIREAMDIDAAYDTDPTPEALTSTAPPRPTMEAHNQQRREQAQQDRDYGNAVKAEPQKGPKEPQGDPRPEPPRDDEKDKAHATPEPERTQAQPAKQTQAPAQETAPADTAAPAPNAEFDTIERMITRKLGTYKSAHMVESIVTDFAQELEDMRISDPARAKRITDAINKKRADLKASR